MKKVRKITDIASLHQDWEPLFLPAAKRTFRKNALPERRRLSASALRNLLRKGLSSAFCITVLFTALGAALPQTGFSALSAESLSSYEMNVSLNDYYQDTLDSSYYAWRGTVRLTGTVAAGEISGSSITAYIDSSLVPFFSVAVADATLADGKYHFSAQVDTAAYARGYHTIQIFDGTVASLTEKTPILKFPVYFEYSEIATIFNVNEYCNMRSDAYYSSSIITQAGLGDSVEVLGQKTGDYNTSTDPKFTYSTNIWNLVRYEKNGIVYTGYISSAFISKMKTGISKMKVTADDSVIPEFFPGKTAYNLNLPFSASTLSIGDFVLYNRGDEVRMLLNDVETEPPFSSLPLATGDNKLEIVVTAAGGSGSVTYTYNIWRIAESTEAEFQAQLAKFPESYKPALLLLHSQYPNWLFTAFNTGLDWETVVSAHDSGSVSLIEIYTPTEYKYSDTIMDGTSFVRASRAAVEYYLDPRNFLGADTVFQFEQLTYQSAMHTLSGIQKLLSGSGLAGYEQMFLTAGAESGVSPYHLAARSRQEVTTWNPVGLSPIATGTYSGAGGIYYGYYNFYNIGTGSSTDLDVLYQRGLSYASGTNPKYGLPWDSALKAIVGGGKYIGANYINVGQDTLYLQKFDVDPTGGLYNHEYMQNVRAPYFEAMQSRQAYSQTGSLTNSFAFRIPVYLNMPALVSPKPEDTNKLSALEVTGYPFTAAFDSSSEKTYYTTVPTSVDKITITAATLNSKATLSGTGEKSLLVGDNTFVISCSPQNGVTRNYTVQVTRSIPELSSNNLLASLSITEAASGALALTPSFEAGQTGPFCATVADTVSEVTVAASAQAATATVTAGDVGVKALAYGLNTLTVRVKAENGDERTYTIQITRSIPKAATSSFVLSDGNLHGVPLQTTVGALKAGMGPSALTFKVFSPSGAECPDTALVGTNMILRVYFGAELKEEHTILMFGDTNGDGKINSTDYAELKFHILKLKLLNGFLFNAGDVNKDGKINSTDYSLMKFHILKLKSIDQK